MSCRMGRTSETAHRIRNSFGGRWGRVSHFEVECEERFRWADATTFAKLMAARTSLRPALTGNFTKIAFVDLQMSAGQILPWGTLV